MMTAARVTISKLEDATVGKIDEPSVGRARSSVPSDGSVNSSKPWPGPAMIILFRFFRNIGKMERPAVKKIKMTATTALIKKRFGPNGEELKVVHFVAWSGCNSAFH